MTSTDSPTTTDTTPNIGGYSYTPSANNYIPPDGTLGGYTYTGSDNSQSDCLCPQPFTGED